MPAYEQGLMDGLYLAEHLPNWLVADVVLRFERGADAVPVEGEWHRGNREGMTMALDSRDSTWRVYADLRPQPW